MVTYSMNVRLVMNWFGLMSIFLDSSFSIRTSPFSVFDISLIVILEISLAIVLQAVYTSGFLSSVVYPVHMRS